MAVNRDEVLELVSTQAVCESRLTVMKHCGQKAAELPAPKLGALGSGTPLPTSRSVLVSTKNSVRLPKWSVAPTRRNLPSGVIVAAVAAAGRPLITRGAV